MTTKIMAMVDALGNLVDFTLLKGQQHDMAGVKPLIEDKEFGALLADKTFDADWLLLDLEARGSKAVIPPKQSRLKRLDFDKEMYKWRHLIESFFAKIKQYLGIATRYDKLAIHFLSAIHLVSCVVWLN